MKKAIVFGASGGVGRALCERLAASGWSLVLVARTAESLERVSEFGVVEQADATDAAQVNGVFERHPGGTAAVNCVGSIVLKPAHLTTPEEFQEVFARNAVTAFNCVRAASRALSEGGSIVLVSSCAARIGLANHEAISAAKAAVEGLTRSAAMTYAPRRIRVNCVAPGLMNTAMSKKITENARALEISKALHPLGRIGEPGDAAAAIQFLIEPEQSWITGQILGVDGGLAALKG